MTVLRYGDTAAREVSKRIATPQANIAAIAALTNQDLADGQVVVDLATGKPWRFSAACTLTGDNLMVAGSGSGTGRCLLLPGKYVFSLPITFATADAAILWTLPTGAILQPEEFYWTVSTTYAGGSSSTIGVSSSTKTGFTTKGDLLGGAAGNLAAVLTAPTPNTTPIMGTIGAGFDTLAKRRATLYAADTIRHDRITSAYTAGVGAVNVVGTVLANPGA